MIQPTVHYDAVNHPAHYTAYPVEVIELTEHLNFCRGSAVKYLARAGLKDPDTEVEDLEKARWYIDREIERLRQEKDEESEAKFREFTTSEDYIKAYEAPVAELVERYEAAYRGAFPATFMAGAEYPAREHSELDDDRARDEALELGYEDLGERLDPRVLARRPLRRTLD